ncbi:zinc transporter foi [Lutzomyia longipalpis]|uniref:zinc transporter foi n=1 Tax=Lutzomyia longipalpis TaxID=7200 RepID=UPI0024835ED5|nr:zinc transporter foi [Lutzomyia longipalpis]XP_055688103.1 zinc transporter foi [Lutzomyia longipalpis]XP_055688104.1 zinc transporter foi [Lutzomyia longipalpis]XP_055688105.1 zinc transporter foi [Lutzomyia longipalpis]
MMSRHLVAVCVVCLLCADHLPCEKHVDHADHPVDGEINPIVVNLASSQGPELGVRVKRHTAIRKIEEHDPGKSVVKEIFKKYGNEHDMTMTLAGFEAMLEQLGLVKYLQQESNPTADIPVAASNESCISSGDLMTKISKDKSIQSSASSPKRSLMQLTEFDLKTVCPILLYQLVAHPTSKERFGCLTSDQIASEEFAEAENLMAVNEDTTLVWVYASLSILGVSLCGLLGVAVIPCMEKKYYHHALQFLVALAVGTLCGDALLHLMPHAMMSISHHHGEGEDDHTTMTHKGLVAVLGIVFFYAMERGLTMIAEWRKRRQKLEKPPSRIRVMRDPESASLNNATGEKLCKHKYSSYPYCYDEIAMETKDDHHHHNNYEKPGSPGQKVAHSRKNNSILPFGRNQPEQQHQEALMHNYTISSALSENHKEPTSEKPEATEETTQTAEEATKNEARHEHSYTVILREHESQHHGHSHTHGHVHSPPSSLSAVAWMVVMGDGLHNFTDGMAIGAAFSNNIPGGFSTAIAVFCHELPHELGDFAVLLKAGMSARQAVYYNLLSSVLSFFGMVLGVFIGDTPEASGWIFAVAAGMFIYIALVDMMPELTSSHQERCALSTCLLQICGMLSGLSVMLLIALYENDLKSIFTTDHDHLHNHHHHNHQHY